MTLHVDITRWSTSKTDWLHFCSQKWRNSTQSVKTKPGSDCDSDHQPLLQNLGLNWESRENTRSSRYGLNQILYDYTVEVTNRCRRLELIEGLKNYGQKFITLYKRWWTKPSARERNARRQNELSREMLQLAEKRRKLKHKGERERHA